MFSDLTTFLKQAVLQPRQTSSIVPSSRRLAQAMAAHVGPQTCPVVEFGPGTGIITQAILERGIAPADLTLFEMNPEFAAPLQQRYPGVRIIVAGAQDIAAHCAPGVGAVVSGLPLLSMPRPLRRAIVAGAFSVLRPGGAMIQFTYGTRPPLSDEALESMGLTAIPATKVWANLPPAQVYILQKRPS